LSGDQREEVEEGSLWIQALKQVAAMTLLTDEDEKNRARLKFLSLIQTLETKQRELNDERELNEEREFNEEREASIKRGCSKMGLVALTILSMFSGYIMLCCDASF
jgi:hypothetical protein